MESCGAEKLKQVSRRIAKESEGVAVDVRTFMAMMQAEDQGSVVSRWERAFQLVDGGVTMNEGSNMFSKDLPSAAEYAEASDLTLPVTREAYRIGLTLAKRK